MRVLELDVRAIERVVKNGKEAGKKFIAYQVYNKETGYYEELRFNSKVKNMPTDQGSHILLVDSNECNRQGTERRKFPLTWVSKINGLKTVTETNNDDTDNNDLPF